MHINKMELFADPDKMPPKGSLSVANVAIDKPFSDYMPKRFTKRSQGAPCGTGTDGKVLWQCNIWDLDTDQTFTVTQEDFMDKDVRIRRLVFLYYG